MKKIRLILFLSLTFLLSSCKNSTNQQDSKVDIEDSQIVSENVDENDTDKNEKVESETETTTDDEYLRVIVEVAGENFLKDKAAMRIDDEVIFGERCAVFKIGTNTEEKFTTERWIAVSENGTVLEYDVAMDAWSEFIPIATSSPEASIQNCIYMLNEVYKQEFGAEYNDAYAVTKKAAYASENAFLSGQLPDFLFCMDEEVPTNAYADPASYCYYPVTNFTSIEEVYKHLRQYFTDWYLESIEPLINTNFFEHEGVLYLVRDGSGYGTTSIDFDTLNASTMENNRLNVGTLFFGSPDIPISVNLVNDNENFKINSAEQINSYPLEYVSETMLGVEIPDFLAFETYNNIGTASNQFVKNELLEDTYTVEYYGDYYELLPQYIQLLEMQGFTIVIDGHEGFYMLEKNIDIGTLNVNAYFKNEEDGVTIEIIVPQAVG